LYNFIIINRYEYAGLSITDKTLEAHIAYNTTKSMVFVPHTAGKWQKKKFAKDNCPIVERLVNQLMFRGRNAGKKCLAIKHVRNAFDAIFKKVKKNPLQVLIDAVSNGSAREDSCRVGSGGTVKRQAVDVSPLRRVNQALYHITQGARKAAFRKKKVFYRLLADEIMAAADNNPQSYAVKKRDDIEKQAKANR